jgi:hypothetical protein
MNRTILHTVGDQLRELFASIPLPVVRWVFLAVPVLLLVWVLLLPRRAVTPPTGTGRWDENLRLWAAVTLIMQIIIYSIF